MWETHLSRWRLPCKIHNQRAGCDNRGGSPEQTQPSVQNPTSAQIKRFAKVCQKMAPHISPQQAATHIKIIQWITNTSLNCPDKTRQTIRLRTHRKKRAVAGEAYIGQAPRTKIQVPQLFGYCHEIPLLELISNLSIHDATTSHSTNADDNKQQNITFERAWESKVAAQTYSWLKRMKVACSSRSNPCRRPIPSCAATTDTANPVTTKLPIPQTITHTIHLSIHN